MKRLIGIILVLLVAAALLGGCSSTKDRIQGIWKFKSSFSGTMSIMLAGDMKFFYKFKGPQDANFDRKMGTYTVEGKRLTLKFRDGSIRAFDVVEIEDNALQMNDLDKNTGGMKMFKKVNRF